VVPREIKILLEETQKSHGKRYGGYILKEKVTGEGSGKGEVVEATESELIKNLWSELSKKKCAPKFIRLKKVGQDTLYVEPENEEMRKLLQNASLDIRQAGERNCRMIIYGVGMEVEDESVAALLEEQNEDSVKLALGWHRRLEIVPRRKRVTRRGRDIEFVVTPEVAGELVGTTLYVGLSRCRVGPSVNIRRCHRCRRYGHIGVSCKALAAVCGGARDRILLCIVPDA